MKTLKRSIVMMIILLCAGAVFGQTPTPTPVPTPTPTPGPAGMTITEEGDVIVNGDLTVNGNLTVTGTLTLPPVEWEEVGVEPLPVFQSNWRNYSSETHGTCAYTKDALGFVHLRGLIVGGLNDTDVFVLPIGYRPSILRMFIASHYAMETSGDNGAKVIVYSNGIVHLIGVSSNTDWVSLDGISFYAGS